MLKTYHVIRNTFSALGPVSTSKSIVISPVVPIYHQVRIGNCGCMVSSRRCVGIHHTGYGSQSPAWLSAAIVVPFILSVMPVATSTFPVVPSPHSEHLGSFRAKLASDVSRTTYYKNDTFRMSWTSFPLCCLCSLSAYFQTEFFPFESSLYLR